MCFEGRKKVLLLIVKKGKSKEQMLIKTVTTLDNLISGGYESITILAQYFMSPRISP